MAQSLLIEKIIQLLSTDVLVSLLKKPGLIKSKVMT